MIDTIRRAVHVFRAVIRQIVFGSSGDFDLSKLKARGLKIGENCHILSGVIIDPSHCWHIEIGNNVTLAPRVHILAHDASTFMHLGYTRIGKVKIGDNVFIGAGSIVMPNVTIGSNTVIGAGSLVSKDVPDGVVVAGNPAKVICSLESFLEKHKRQMERLPRFEEEYTIVQDVSPEMKEEMNRRMVEGQGYVR
ncbi:MAG: acyltransferase [Anaerolineae bacterium]